jgi:hypothetical protein
MPKEIKPCPFCGHNPDLGNLMDSLHPTGSYWREEEGFRHYFRRDQQSPGDGQVWTFGCLETEGGCGAEIRADSRDEVLAAWNRREESKPRNKG